MENRANYALVGLFTLAVLAGAFGFVYWFKRAGENGDRRAYRIVFTGSVSGLSKGSVVRFNGLRVGEVTTIEIMPSDPGKVLATVEVDRLTPMKSDTKARLEYQGLTGVASVQLTGGVGDAPELAAPEPGEKPILFADRSDYQDILETVQRLATKADAVLTRVDSVFAKSEDSILATVRNVETFSGALARNADTVDSTVLEISRITDKVSKAADRLENVMIGAEKFFGDGQDGQVKSVMNEISETAKAIRVLAANLDKRTGEITVGINRFTGPGLRDIEALAAESRKAVGDLSRAVRSFEKNPQQLLFGGRSNIPEYRQ